jgi:GDP-L-fucose synthase
LTGYEGDKVRALIFIEDFVRILLDLCANSENDIVNIGAGEEFTIPHFARMIYDFEGRMFDTDKYAGTRSRCLRVEKLSKIIPDISLMPPLVGAAHSLEH